MFFQKGKFMIRKALMVNQFSFGDLDVFLFCQSAKGVVCFDHRHKNGMFPLFIPIQAKGYAKIDLPFQHGPDNLHLLRGEAPETIDEYRLAVEVITLVQRLRKPCQIVPRILIAFV
ncbi:hypothetical protein SDC9_122493 [bioreactor metagenome]|uniref:Uncharacterized protein n=1 Tax=bioreactor metagenome TaxID=1076179 RepID=A0A645CF03_9ZZZZ